MILLLDQNGRVVESENEALLTVALLEENPNQSVSSSVLSQPVKITRGRAVIPISDSEAETVTLIPSSALGLKVQTGTVTFGRFATKGIGVLLWREVIEEKKKK